MGRRRSSPFFISSFITYQGRDRIWMNIVAVTSAKSKSARATRLYNVDQVRGSDQVCRDFLGLDCCVRCVGAASCQAAAKARRNVVFLAALRLTPVQPLRPQAPVTGEKTFGSARTSISCSTGVTFTIAHCLFG